MFNFEQSTYKRFRTALAERRRPVAFWIGAGFSAPAGLPTWAMLKTNLIRQGIESLSGLPPSEGDLKEEALQRCKQNNNYWESFEEIKKIIGNAEFIASIRDTFRDSNAHNAPLMFDRVWELLGVNAVITLNIDGFANKSHRRVRSSETPVIFNGRDAPSYAHLLSARRPFIANLHGILDDNNSWVFTKTDVNQLFGNPAYRSFLSMIFSSMTVVFAGISADDLAAGGTLASLTKQGLDLGEHYWITDRSNVHEWASKAGIQVIRYTPEVSASETERHIIPLKALFNDLLHFRSRDPKPSTVVPNLEPIDFLPSSKELRNFDEDVLRLKLSGYAKNLLGKNSDGTKSQAYADFLTRYSSNIHQSWHISSDDDNSTFYGHKVVKQIHQSPFSTIWELQSADGKRLALKVLRIENLKSGPQIDSFRRGVESLRYLTKAEVPFTAPLVEAYEIPTSVVMQFIDGGSLTDVVMSGVFSPWPDLLQIMSNVCQHLINSHNLPQSVLHRDVRPSNIMLPFAYWNESDALMIGHSRSEVALLNYDMSWHSTAAGQSISGNLEEAGYYSPEQMISNAEGARSTLVDSYGVAMTLFFSFTKLSPPAAGSKSTEWEKLLDEKIRVDSRLSWRSAPARLRRLIREATNSDAGQRPSVSQIQAELNLLVSAVSGKIDSLPPDFWAEELLSRSEEAEYETLPDREGYKRSPRSGRSIILRGDLRAKNVVLTFKNQAMESTNRSGVDRLWSEKLDRAKDILIAQGWEMINTHYSGMEILLSAKISIGDVRSRSEKIVQSLKRGLAQVRIE